MVLPHTEKFLSRLDGIKKTGNGWDARCPCRNDDNNPSLSVAESNEGKVVVFCHRGGGCSAKEVCEAVGLELKDLMPPSDRPFNFDAPAFKSTDEKPKLVADYNYLDADGKLLFQKRRWLKPDGGKTFTQRKPDGSGGWANKLDDRERGIFTPRVLYNLPNVLKAKSRNRSIWVVEGEKDADTLNAIGAVATTMPNGAGTWLDIHTETLAGATVDIIADNDKSGRQHAAHVLEELTKAGCDVKAWICPREKDITAFLEAGGSTEELIPFTPDPEEMKSSTLEDVESSDTEQPVDEINVTYTEVVIGKLKQLLENEKLSPTALINRASLLVNAAMSDAPVSQGRLVKWDEFLKESDDETYDWVIPGLLERRERVIVVAAEGVGKTMLARQVALLTAHGVHPFTFAKMPQITTLTIDLENPERIIRRSSRTIMATAAAQHYAMSSNAHIVIKPDGLNLLNSGDRLLLENYIEQIKPDLLVMGPLYKSFLDPGNKTSEAVAIEVVKYLDTIRAVYGCALWLEHHAPLGESAQTRNLRPFGSAVWSRWPEFGISLQPDPMAVGEYVYDVKHFRGERDERQWPLKMKRGKKWPFETIEFKAKPT